MQKQFTPMKPVSVSQTLATAGLNHAHARPRRFLVAASALMAAAAAPVSGAGPLEIAGATRTIDGSAAVSHTYISIGALEGQAPSSLEILNDSILDTTDTTAYDFIGKLAFGQVLVNRSTWNSGTKALYVGESSNGMLIISNGGKVISTGSEENVIGKEAGSSGSVLVGGAESKWSDNNIVNKGLIIGEFGQGRLEITNGGKVTSGSAGTTFIGKETGSSGEVSVAGSDSEWDIRYQTLYVGGSGEGRLEISNGGKVIAANSGLPSIVIASEAGSTGSIEVSGEDSCLETMRYVYVGYEGVGSLLVSDGGKVTVNDSNGSNLGVLSIGSMPDSVEGSNVTVTGSGSILEVNQIELGKTTQDGYIPAELEITDGGKIMGKSAILSGGTATISGEDSLWEMERAIFIASLDHANATLLISDGARVVNNTDTDFEDNGPVIGNNAGSVGRVVVSGKGFWEIRALELVIGKRGDGSLEINTGGVVSTRDIVLGEYDRGHGSITVSDSDSLLESESLYVGFSGTGELTIKEGGTVGAENVIFAVNADSSGTLNLLSGGVLEAESLYAGSGKATFNLNGGTIRAMADDGDFFANVALINLNATDLASGAAALTFDTNGYDVTLASEVDGNSKVVLRKTGDGTLKFAEKLNSRITLELSQGDAEVQAKLYGTAHIATGATLHFASGGSPENSAVISGTGTVTATVSGSGGVFDSTGAIISPGTDGSGTLTLGGGGDWLLNGITLSVKLGENNSSTKVHSLNNLEFGDDNTIELTNTTWQSGKYTLLTVEESSVLTTNDLDDTRITYKGVRIGEGNNLRLVSKVALSNEGNALVLTTQIAPPLALTWTVVSGSNVTWQHNVDASIAWSADGKTTNQSFLNGDVITFLKGGYASDITVASEGVIVGAMKVVGTYHFSGGIIAGIKVGSSGDQTGVLSVESEADVTFQNEIKFETVNNSGTLTAGIVIGDATNQGTFTAQSIDGNVTNAAGGTFSAGTVTGDVTNAATGIFSVGDVSGTVTNEGTIHLLGNTIWGTLANNGLVKFRNVGETLTITGDLSQHPGQTSTFALDVNLNSALLSDCIVVNGQVTGSHHLRLLAQSEEASGNLGSGIVVLSAPNDAVGDETITGEVIGALHTYDIGLTADQKGYAITRAIAPSPNARVLNSTLGAMSIAWFAQMDSVAKRFGELRTTGDATTKDPDDFAFWMRAHGQQVNAHLGGATAKFREHQYGGDIGADKVFTLDGGRLYLGAFLGYDVARRDFRDGFGSKSDTDSIAGGLYATYAGAGGLYANATVKGQYFDHEYRIPAPLLDQRGQFDNVGIGVLLEVGQRLDLGASAGTSYYFEPAVRFDYAHIFAENFNTSGGLRVNASDSDLYRFATDLRGGVRFSVNTESWLQVEGSLGAQYQLSSGGAIRLSDTAGNSVRHVPTTDGLRAVIGLGVTWQMDATQGIHLSYEAAFGEKYDIPWNLNLSWRKRF